MFDFQLSLHFSAKEDKWRVYDSYGDYATANTTFDVPKAIHVLLASASERLKRMSHTETSPGK